MIFLVVFLIGFFSFSGIAASTTLPASASSGSASLPASTVLSFKASFGVHRPPTPTTALVAVALAAFLRHSLGPIRQRPQRLRQIGGEVGQGYVCSLQLPSSCQHGLSVTE